MTTAFSNYEVTAEDQQRINLFSRLVTQKVDIVEERKKLRQEKEKLEDAQLELELLDEDSEVHRRIGECYILVKQAQAMVFLNSEKETLEIW
ncbi:Prefoldin subunit 4 [Galdieria sulphuraria]|nr:Prefoldin subunit 4 [Galdieria sulphuraria]